MPPAMPVEQRFWRHVDRSGGPEACWLWTAFVHKGTGYGKVMMLVDGRWLPRQAHRVAFELTRGPIAVGLHLDHLCRTRICVNPVHLDPVTQAENNRRADSAWAKKTHCPAGHAYDEANTYVTPRGSRDCRICITERSRRSRRRQREAAA